MPNPSTLPVDVSQWAYAGLVAENGHLTADNARLNATLEQLSQELNTKSDAHTEAVKKNKLLEKKLENEHAKGVKLLEDERAKGTKLQEKWEAEKRGLQKQLGEKQSQLDNLSNRIRNVKGAFDAYQGLEKSKLDELRSAHKEHTDRLEEHFKSELIRMTANVTQFLAGQRDDAIARVSATFAGADAAGGLGNSGIGGGSGGAIAAGVPGGSRPAGDPRGPAEENRSANEKGKQREKQNDGREMDVDEQNDIDPSFGDDQTAPARLVQPNLAGPSSDQSTVPLPDPQPQRQDQQPRPQRDRMVSSRSRTPDAGPQRSTFTTEDVYGGDDSRADESTDHYDGSTAPTTGKDIHMNRQRGHETQLEGTKGANAETRQEPAGISVNASSQQSNREIEGSRDTDALPGPATSRVDDLSATASRRTGNEPGSAVADLEKTKPNRALAAEIPVASSSQSPGPVTPFRSGDGDHGDVDVTAKAADTSSSRGVGRPAKNSKLKRKNVSSQGRQGNGAAQEADGETIVLPVQTGSPVTSPTTLNTGKGKKRRVDEDTPARSTRARASGSGSNGASGSPVMPPPVTNTPSTRQGQVQARRGSSASRRNTPVGHHPILPLVTSASARSDVQEERPTPFIFARTSARLTTSHVDTHMSLLLDSERESRLRTEAGLGMKQVEDVDIKPDMMMIDREDRPSERRATVDVEISEDPFLQNTHTSSDPITNKTIAGPNTSRRSVSARSRQTSNNMNSASAKKRGRKRIPSVLGTFTLPVHLDDDDNDPLGLGFDPL